MRKVLVFGAAFAAAALSAAAVPADARTQPSPRPATPGPPVTGTATARAVMVTAPAPSKATYAYGKDSRHRVDVYWRGSRSRAKRPGVLLLHGGYWSSGDKSSWKYTARKLTAHGYTVFAPNYRYTTKARWPAQRDDVLAALTFVQRNARRWHLDARRIAVMGSSAGAHLATQVGTYGSGPRVRGVVALSGVNSPYLAYQDGGKPAASAKQLRLREAVVSLVGCTPSEIDLACWNRLEDAASATHVSGRSAPMLLWHSEAEFVPATQGTGLASALRGAGVRASVRTSPGSLHGAELLRDDRTFRTVLAWLNSVTRR